MQIKQRGSLFNYVTMSLLLIVLAIVSVFIGVQDLSISDVFSLTDIQQTILFTTRIPRTISLILAGSTLSVSGLLMQHITQNRFVSPTTAGTMASARFGIVVTMVYFTQATLIERTLVSFFFAILGTIFFTTFLRTIKLNSSVLVPLVGMMFGNIVNSLSSYLAIQNELVQNVSSWLQGNFSLITSENYQLLLLSIPLIILIFLFAHYFTIMGLGKDLSTELGIPYYFFEMVGIILVSLATTTVILTVGSIPFVGIIIPNLVSLKKGDHFGKILIPSAFLGSIFLIITDIFSRVIVYPYEMPISVVVGVIGSVLFMYLMLRGEKG